MKKTFFAFRRLRADLPVDFCLKAANKSGRLPKTASRCFLVLLVPALIFFDGRDPEALAQKRVSIPYEGTIVLDPGHGGRDAGVRGPDGKLEKAVTLSLARRIAVGLNPNYRVVLTRTDDYRLGIADRTAVANHEKATLFVSLHVGGSFLHQATGMAVYYFAEAADQAQKALKAEPKPDASAEQAVPWDSVQQAHAAASLELAKLMQKEFSRHRNVLPLDLQGAPLMVLRGADMPAIMLEIGYLTNPVDEQMLSDAEKLKGLADIISAGINKYLETKGP